MKYKSNRPFLFRPLFSFLFVVTWYQGLCSEHTKRILSKHFASGGNDNNGISLAFVFDRTGSMYDDLVQVRTGAARILNSTIANGENAVRNYILVPFRDPGVGPAFKTEDPAKFLKALNEINVHGGKDCPEMSVTAIKQALEQSLPHSVIYVFTDAEAKDHRLLPEVVKLIKDKKARVNFILTGNCGLEPHEIIHPDPYETIATVSQGQILNLNKSEVNKIWGVVELSINLKRKSIFSGDKLTRGKHTYTVEIHSLIDQIIATVSGVDVNVTVRDARGRLLYPQDGVEELIKSKDVVSVSFRNPEPGNWSFTVESTGRHTLRVEGISNRWLNVTDEHTVVVIPADIDECARGVHNCREDEECENIPNGFTCIRLKQCSRGLKMVARRCVDIDECSRNPQICGKRKCVNVYRSYRCECPDGFRQDGKVCTDINECIEYPTICRLEAECLNTDGSFRCLARCEKGLTRGRNGVCTDIDECSENSRLCGDGECINTHASYRCKTSCSKGFRRDEKYRCIDINECSRNPPVCGNRQCINTRGSYRCETTPCPDGFTRTYDGVCTDINECSQSSFVCGDRDCVNTRGSYRCEPKCEKGFVRDGGAFCTDIDECSDHPRRCQHECKNTVGSFQCLCPRGSRLDADNFSCVRVKTCPRHGFGSCQYKCNTDSGQCECPEGYRLHWDERSCVDINECLTGKQKCGSWQCFNTLGRYHCMNVTCPQGYFLDRDGSCSKHCYYQSHQCPVQYSTVRHSAVSIPCYLPLNTDFLQLQPYIPRTTDIFNMWSTYCSVYFYPIHGSSDVFGIYQDDQVGRLYNRVVFDKPAFYEFQVVSDYFNSYGNVISRTTFHVFVDVSKHAF